MSELFADIIVDISHENLDRTFQYRIPDELRSSVAVGDRVLIPFGKGNREIAGFVLDVSDTAKFDPAKTKSIISVLSDDTLVEQKLIVLAHWMKQRYGSTTNRALATALPVKKNIKNAEKRDVVLLLADELDIVALATELMHNGRAVGRLTSSHAFNINLVGPT